jgi:hypothetical protein
MVPEDRRGEPSDPFRPSAYAHWVLLLSFVLIAANAWVGTRSGFGRPQELLSSGSPAGRGAALMSAHLGPGPGWLVHRGKAGSALETPALREMEADAARIAMATGAEAPAGWPEFLASLGGGAGKASELTREARDQLLLLLGRPDDLSAFVDGPRGVAVSRIPWPSRLDAKNVQGAVAGGSVTLAGRRAEAELAASVRRGTLTLMAMFVLPFLAMDLARARRGWVGLSLIAASCVLIAGWPGPALLGPLLCAVLPAVAVGLRARLDVRRVLLAALILLVPAVSPLLPVRHLALGASLAFALAALFLGSRQAANARESSPGGHRVSLRIG